MSAREREREKEREKEREREGDKGKKRDVYLGEMQSHRIWQRLLHA